MDISLNKYISETGYCSRREADRLIEAGRVLLNNEIAVTGNRYTEGDEVVVDGSIVKPANKEKMVILAFNKPIGITTTTDENIRGNIISYLNYPKRIFPIGRLDKDSEGLIFLTNNGDIVNKILRAGNQHEKEYQVRVDKNIDGTFLRNMSEGVRIDGVTTLPCRVKQTGKHSFNVRGAGLQSDGSTTHQDHGHHPWQDCHWEMAISQRARDGIPPDFGVWFSV